MIDEIVIKFSEGRGKHFMSSDKVNTHKVEGHPGAMVWELKEEPGIFYLTNSRGSNRHTHQLEASKLVHALKEAKDCLS
jgi:hypothetical protein